MQVHADIMDGRYRMPPFAASPSSTWVAPDVRIEEGAVLEGPCFIDEGAIVKAGARIGPYSVVGRQCHVEEHAVIDHAIVWANCRISQEAVVRRSILGRHCHVGRNALVEDGVVLGDKSVVTDFSRL
jgi:NDP-sugar pyrophosphorylase family protein